MKFRSSDRISFMKINQDLRKSLVLKLRSITFLTLALGYIGVDFLSNVTPNCMRVIASGVVSW